MSLPSLSGRCDDANGIAAEITSRRRKSIWNKMYGTTGMVKKMGPDLRDQALQKQSYDIPFKL